MFKKSSAIINLPSMPEAISRIIEITASSDIDTERLARVVLMDQSLTSRVMRLANSALYARCHKTHTVTEAILRMGSSQLRNLAASASVIEALLPKRSFPGFDWKEMWNHSVTCGVSAQCIYGAITGSVRVKDESVFISGLLHDIGKMVIAYALPMKFTGIVAKCCESDWDMLKAERKYLSTNHAEIGGQLASEWQLPEKLQIGIRYHHCHDVAADDIDVAKSVYAGNLLAKRLSRNYIYGQTWDVSLDQVAEAAGLDTEDMIRVVNDTRYGLTRCKEILCWGDDMPKQDRMAA